MTALEAIWTELTPPPQTSSEIAPRLAFAFLSSPFHTKLLLVYEPPPHRALLWAHSRECLREEFCGVQDGTVLRDHPVH